MFGTVLVFFVVQSLFNIVQWTKFVLETPGSLNPVGVSL